jgi:hypothetical protein
MLLVRPPVDELDETGLSDTEVLGTVHSFNREAAERDLLGMVEDHLADYGPVPEGHEIRMHFTTYIRYCG